MINTNDCMNGEKNAIKKLNLTLHISLRKEHFYSFLYYYYYNYYNYYYYKLSLLLFFYSFFRTSVSRWFFTGV